MYLLLKYSDRVLVTSCSLQRKEFTVSSELNRPHGHYKCLSPCLGTCDPLFGGAIRERSRISELQILCNSHLYDSTNLFIE